MVVFGIHDVFLVQHFLKLGFVVAIPLHQGQVGRKLESTAQYHSVGAWPEIKAVGDRM